MPLKACAYTKKGDHAKWHRAQRFSSSRGCEKIPKSFSKDTSERTSWSLLSRDPDGATCVGIRGSKYTSPIFQVSHALDGNLVIYREE